MAKSKKKSDRQTGSETNETLARKIWLAGLGAYGKGVREAQGQIDKASQEAQRAFDELVSKGQKLEDATLDHIADARERLSADAMRDRINEARDRLSERLGEVASDKPRSVDEMITRVREKMGVDEGVARRLDGLSREVSELAKAVASIAGGRRPKQKAGVEPEEPVSRGTRPTRKSAAKKAASRKKAASKRPAATSATAKKRPAVKKKAATKKRAVAKKAPAAKRSGSRRSSG